MTILNVLETLATHPWLTAFTIISLALVLHLPYRVEERRDRQGHIHGVYQSLVYRYEFGPTYERLEYSGLRHAQRTILALLSAAWAMLRGNVLRLLIRLVRQRLGW